MYKINPEKMDDYGEFRLLSYDLCNYLLSEIESEPDEAIKLEYLKLLKDVIAICLAKL